MSDSVEERARQAALSDWEKQTVRCLTVGTLEVDFPFLGHEPDASPFYIGSLGCEASPENLRFCAAYNEAISRFVLEHGVPAWSPAARRPDREAVLEVLSREGRPLDHLRRS